MQVSSQQECQGYFIIDFRLWPNCDEVKIKTTKGQTHELRGISFDFWKGANQEIGWICSSIYEISNAYLSKWKSKTIWYT